MDKGSIRPIRLEEFVEKFVFESGVKHSGKKQNQ